MKKILLILLSMFVAVPGMMAQPGYMHYHDRQYAPGVLQVSLSDNYPITVAIDGRYYKKQGPMLTIGGLPPGRHYLKIYEYTPADDDGSANAHLVYENKIHIFENSMTSFILDANSGQVDIRRQDLNDNNPQANSGNGNNMDPNNPEANNNGNNYNNGSNEDAPPPPPPPAEPNDNAGVPRPTIGSVYTQPSYPKISKASLDNLGVKVNAKVTDVERMQIVKKGLAKKAVNTNQLSLMMTWFNFESSRVELLQWAYDHTTDKQNYHRLKDQLTYESSKEDLDNVINSNK